MTPETATACPRAEGGFDALTKVTFYIWISTSELNQDFSIHHEAYSAATPQPKWKQTFHHEGHEDHEVQKL